MDSPVKPGNDKECAEMTELVNLRFIDYSDKKPEYTDKKK
jgi:hypothetical protein